MVSMSFRWSDGVSPLSFAARLHAFSTTTARVYFLERSRCVIAALPDICRAHHCDGEKAGMLPGITYYLSMWYPKTALARRIGVVYSSSTLANAFGGLLAFAIEKMNGCDPFYRANILGSLLILRQDRRISRLVVDRMSLILHVEILS